MKDHCNCNSTVGDTGLGFNPPEPYKAFTTPQGQYPYYLNLSTTEYTQRKIEYLATLFQNTQMTSGTLYERVKASIQSTMDSIEKDLAIERTTDDKK